MIGKIKAPKTSNEPRILCLNPVKEKSCKQRVGCAMACLAGELKRNPDTDACFSDELKQRRALLPFLLPKIIGAMCCLTKKNLTPHLDKA